MQVLTIGQLKQYIDEHPLVNDHDSIAYESAEQRLARSYAEVLENLVHYKYCKTAIDEWNVLLIMQPTLQQVGVSDWAIRHQPYFSEHLVLCGVDYLENETASELT